MSNVAVSSEEAKTKTAGVRPTHGAHRVLIVDDDKTIRELFLQVVSYGLPNCRVDLAVNGAEAVEEFRQARHSVLVMDLKMPVMDGEQAFAEIVKLCKAESWTMPSVIFCSGYVPSDRISIIIEDSPAHCLLLKPITAGQLLDAIKVRLPPE